MKHIFWSETHITVLTDKIEAKPHSHLMLQIFIKCGDGFSLIVNGKRIYGNFIVVDCDIEHSILASEELDCFMLISAPSVLAQQLQSKYIKEAGYAILPVKKSQDAFVSFCKCPNKEMSTFFSAAVFNELGVSFYHPSGYDQRIKKLLRMLEEYSVIEDSVEEIAKRLNLSSSRLSHLFHEQTGVPIKSYSVLCKLKKAYLLLFNGKNITTAAVEAGFYSSSHLADVNRRMMGMTISELMDNSRFIEVNKS